MKKRAPIGVDNFEKLTNPKNNYIFVDRTPLLKTIIEDGAEVIALHAFRRMGKSLFASMLYHFFSPQVLGVSTKGMFDALAINQNAPEMVAEYQGQYPVVMLSLKKIQASTFEMALDGFHSLISDAYLRYPELLNSSRLTQVDKDHIALYTSVEHRGKVSEMDIISSLKKLTELLYKHYDKKVWVIIDEYDTPLASAYYHDYFSQLLNFMKGFLGDALKGNDYLEKGILLGILRLTKESLLSSLNNPKISTLLHPFGYQPYFGFTEAEVNDLFAQVGLTHEIHHVRSWYNGYHIDGQSLYNPWSIINCLDNQGELKGYWVNTANDKMLYDSLVEASEEIKALFEQLVVEGKPVEGNLNERIRFENLSYDEDALWSLLHATGYLTSDNLKLNADGYTYKAQLRIPNQEVRGLYIGTFQQWLTDVFVGHNTVLLKALVRHDMKEFTELLQDYLLEYASVNHLKYEGCYHSLVLGLLYGLQETHYVFSGTLESGHGFSDLLLVPKKDTNTSQALLIEFKHLKKNETGEEALQKALEQIQQLEYTRAVKRYAHITTLLKVGMAFAQKTVFWQSDEETILR